MTNRTRDVELAPRARVADTRWTRLRGLLGRARLRPGQGLVISPSRGVHTWGMGYPIDVALVDSDGRVAAVYPGLEPWSRTRMHGDAELAVELPEGTIGASGTRPGDRIEIDVVASDDGEEGADDGRRVRGEGADGGSGAGPSDEDAGRRADARRTSRRRARR